MAAKPIPKGRNRPDDRVAAWSVAGDEDDNPFRRAREQRDTANAAASDAMTTASVKVPTEVPIAVGSQSWWWSPPQMALVARWDAAYSSALQNFSLQAVSRAWRRPVTAAEAAAVPAVGDAVRAASADPPTITAAVAAANAQVPAALGLLQQSQAAGSSQDWFSSPGPLGLGAPAPEKGGLGVQVH